MLDWKNLTNWQRIMSVVFLFFLVLALLVIAADALQQQQMSTRGILAMVAVSSFILATLLNPDAVRGRSAATNPLSFPPLCAALYGLAGLAMLLKGVFAFSGYP